MLKQDTAEACFNQMNILPEGEIMTPDKSKSETAFSTAVKTMFRITVLCMVAFITACSSAVHEEQESPLWAKPVPLPGAARYYDFPFGELNEALANLDRGGPPVILIREQSAVGTDYYVKMRKYVLNTPEFKARNGKDFILFFNDETGNPLPDYLFEEVGNRTGYRTDHAAVIVMKEKEDNQACSGPDFKPETWLQNIGKYLRARPKEFTALGYRGSLIGKYYKREKKKYDEAVKQQPPSAVRQPDGTWIMRPESEKIKMPEFIDLIRSGEFSCEAADRDGTPLLHYVLNHANGIMLPGPWVLELIDMLKTKNLPHEFWSEALLLHACNLFCYYIHKDGKELWIKIADRLIESGADINYAEPGGRSVAYMVFRKSGPGSKSEDRDRLSVLSFLISKGMDPNRIHPNLKWTEDYENLYFTEEEYIPKQGVHPWGAWSTRYSWDDIRVFVDEFHVDINAPGQYGRTYLQYVVQTKSGNEKCVKTVREMLERGADPGKADWNGTTPLMLACARWDDPLSRRIAEAMLEVKSDLNAEDREGKTAFEHLPENCRIDEKMLRMFMAKGMSCSKLDVRYYVYRKREDLALLVLENGGIVNKNTLAGLKKDEMPALRASVKALPEERFTPVQKEAADRNILFTEYSYRRELLEEAEKLLKEGTRFYEWRPPWGGAFGFIKGISYPVGPDPMGLRVWLNSSFLYDAGSGDPEIRRANVTGTALALVYAFYSKWIESFGMRHRASREVETLYYKGYHILRLMAVLRCSAELFWLKPEIAKDVYRYLPQTTVRYIEQKVMAAKKKNTEMEAAVDPVLSEIVTAYWTGTPPAGCPEIANDIAAFWHKAKINIDFHIAGTEARNIRKHQRVGKGKYQSIKGLSNDLYDDLSYHKVIAFLPEPDTLSRRLEDLERTFRGAAPEREKFSHILRLIARTETGRKLLAELPAGITFAGGFPGDGFAVFMTGRNVILLGHPVLTRSGQKNPAATLQLAEYIVHEMTHAQQESRGLMVFSRDLSKRQGVAVMKLMEIHPLLNQYLFLKEIGEIPEFAEVSKVLRHDFHPLEEILEKEHGPLWKNEFTRLYWLNGDPLIRKEGNTTKESPYYHKIRNWFMGYYYHGSQQFQNARENMRDDGNPYERLLDGYCQLMDISLPREFFEQNDPRTTWDSPRYKNGEE